MLHPWAGGEANDPNIPPCPRCPISLSENMSSMSLAASSTGGANKSNVCQVSELYWMDGLHAHVYRTVCL